MFCMYRLALERTTNAQDAIRLMGKLAEEMGFYAADWWSGGAGSLGEGGEALTVIDPNEAWVFHVLADDTGTSAIWVAQRVPPDHVSVVANQFTIKFVIPNSKDFMYSSNIFEIAQRNNLWKDFETDGYLNFQAVYGLPRAHSTYATRRMWRVFDIIAPSLHLSPIPSDHFASNYPFSVKAEKKVTPQTIMSIFRDHYEGTAYDLTKGLAAGPYGDPNRFDVAAVDNMTYIEAISGGYERAISMYRTSYSMISQARSRYPHAIGGRVWFSASTPRAGCYIPLYLAAEYIPTPYTRGSLFKYDTNIAYWKFNSVGNYASRYYKYAMQDVKNTQSALEDSILSIADTTDENAFSIYKMSTNKEFAGIAKSITFTPSVNTTNHEIIRLYTNFQQTQSDRIMTTWTNLFELILTK